MKPIIKITRYNQDENQTLGTCVVLGDNDLPLYVALSLERGWRNNEQNISCIPKGLYEVKLEWSNRFKQMLWEIKGVEGRSECKFHSANYWFQLNGCVANGLRLKKLNADNYYDITNSKDTMRAFHAALKPYTEALLLIESKTGIF